MQSKIINMRIAKVAPHVWTCSARAGNLGGNPPYLKAFAAGGAGWVWKNQKQRSAPWHLETAIRAWCSVIRHASLTGRNHMSWEDDEALFAAFEA